MDTVHWNNITSDEGREQREARSKKQEGRRKKEVAQAQAQL
jgi:hypothetical protein